MTSAMQSPPNPTLVRVFKIPPPNGDFCFGSGKPAKFVEVDWFHDREGMMQSEMGRSEVREFVSGKFYARSGEALLVVSPAAAFTINYDASRDPFWPS